MSRMLKFRKIFLKLLLYFTTIVLFSLPKITYADTILFTDNFDDGIADGWTVITVGSYLSVNSFRYGGIITPQFTIADSVAGSTSWTNYIYEIDITAVQGEDKNLIFRFTDSSHRYGYHISAGSLKIEKVIPGFAGDVASAPITFLNGITYHMKIVLNGNNIRIYQDGTEIISYTDESDTKMLQGNIGIRVGTGVAAPSEVWFDNVVVTEISSGTPTPTPTPTPSPSPTPSPTPTPTASPTPTPSPTSTPTPSPTPTPNPFPSLIVTDLKQYEGGWENDIYDNTTGKIKQFGCALTSASMVLKYHGFSNADPKILNNWLKGQLDGYLGNGLINWLAVSRYTYLNKSLSSPTLEFRKVLASDSNLINELNNARPAILKEPGHFIVAKSQTSNSFGINDPGYNNRPTLTSYNNSYSGIYSYRRTYTNLSYILLTLNSNYDLKVYDPDGNEIIGYTYTEEGINDNEGGGQNSGGSLTIFEYPTPLIGQYTIDVTGPEGPYTIKSYTYDEEGNLTDNGPTTTTTSSFNLYLNYDSDSSTPPIETGAVISGQSSTTPSTSTALISWTTDKLSSSRVIYDTVSHSQLGSPVNYNYLYSSETFDSISKVLSHSVLLTGLSSGQMYYYRVVSSGSPTAVSEEKTFRTLSEAGPPPPAESNIVLGSITTGFPFYKTFFVANEFPAEEKPTVQEETKQEVLGKEAPPSKSFFMKNLGWFITLFLSSGGLFLIQLRRLLRLIAKRKILKEKGGNRNRRTSRVKPQRKRQHN